MFCPALPTGGKVEVDDESFSWAVSILASGYLAVLLLFYLFIPFMMTYFLVYHNICSNKLLTDSSEAQARD